ncbi:putative glycoside hydrolase [Clostridium sediminicola]|uniref:putative glycoside hydrolase n=1 Tax=Clostridium sediminicola TaxID=3114879 RepID=UPI0031F2123B
MNSKKKIALLISIVLILSAFSGCNKGSNTSNKGNNTGITDDKNQNEIKNETPKDEESDESEKIEENEQKDESKQGKEVYINANPLILREGPTSNTKRIGKILKSEAVVVEAEITNDTGEVWYKINFDGNEGYISSKYTVDNKFELIPKEYQDLDYSPQEKIVYEDNKPVKVKGVYVTRFSTVSKNFDYLLDIADKSGINTFVIDVKDDRGHMLFYSEAASKIAPKANEGIVLNDIKGFIQKLKEHNIYTIARIVSFKDPIYAEAHPDRAIINRNDGSVFTKSDGLSWVSAYDRQLWDYNVSVAKEAAIAGFNEIQFDYVRFPASNGGKLDKELDYRNSKNESKPKAIQEYLKYAKKELSPHHVYIGADIYGLVASVTNDMSLGQYWEAISNVVDYVCPMMYPSHYANGTYDIPIPDANPGDTVYYSTKDSVRRNGNVDTPAIIRPWIQDFTAPWVKGYIKYGPDELLAQIEALEKNGVDEYLLWNASNKYSYTAVK